MKEFTVYTLLRLGLFVASYTVIVGVYLLATGGDSVPVFWPLLAAIVVSSVAAVYLLRPQRERLAAVVQRRADAASRRFEQTRAKEDASEEPRDAAS